MLNIEDTVLNNYQENLEYFKKNHEQLYTKLIALETMLVDGRYNQKYELEYKDDYFDVVELKNGTFLYNDDSNVLSKKIVDSINTRRDEHVFESFKNYNFHDEDIDTFKALQADQMYSTTAPTINYYNQNISKSSKMKEIYKFIFLGTGLGLHIPPLVEKYEFKVTMIIEDDIELFRLSLFTCNYSQVFKNKMVYFSIGQNSHEFELTFTKFFEMSFALHHYMKFFCFSDYYETKIKEIQTLLLTRPEKSYPHEFLLIKNKKVIRNIIEQYKFLNILKKEDERFFNNKPTIIIGAGPSLDKNIKWLRENRDKLVIIAALASLKTLLRENIYPDVILQVDEKEAETEILLDKLEDKSFFKYTPCILSASVPKVLLELCKRDNVFLIEDRTHYKLNKSYLESASIGEAMSSIALIFNVKSLYLLGLDFALSDDGKLHSKEHHQTDKLREKLDNVKDDDDSVDMDSTLIQRKGNFREKVYTTPRLALSIPIFNQRTREYKTKDQHIYNLNDGVFLEDTIPTYADNCVLDGDIDKKALNKELIKLFNNYSDSLLDDNELATIQKRKEQIEMLKGEIKKFKETPTSSQETFSLSYATLINNILQQNHLELIQILTIYLLNISSYIFDFFNTEGLNNPKKHMKKLKADIIRQLEKIINSYEEEFMKLKNNI